MPTDSSQNVRRPVSGFADECQLDGEYCIGYATHQANGQVRAKKKYPITCAYCGQEAQADRPEQKYCSVACGGHAASNTRSEQLRLARVVRTLPVIYTGPQYARPRREVPHLRGRLIWRTGQCRICSEWFTHWNLDVTCSSACLHELQRERTRTAKHKRRALKKNAFVANVNRRSVFETDGYRCHLCKRKTDPTKQVPHPRAPTLDHVIPLACGGTHEPANVRTACFLCNALKGNRGGGEQFALAI